MYICLQFIQSLGELAVDTHSARFAHHYLDYHLSHQQTNKQTSHSARYAQSISRLWSNSPTNSLIRSHIVDNRFQALKCWNGLQTTCCPRIWVMKKLSFQMNHHHVAFVRHRNTSSCIWMIAQFSFQKTRQHALLYLIPLHQPR